MIFNPKLNALISELKEEFSLISENRKSDLKALAKQIEKQLKTLGQSRLIIICTHNSRRSQLGQIWVKLAALHYGLDSIHSYSGGTERTAFNTRMVKAMQRAGFNMLPIDSGPNPKYALQLADKELVSELYYSKKYNENYNPQENFIAVMVCDDAAEACPIVHGASVRILLTYKDPKTYDNTEEESVKYDEKIREIGREMLYSLSLIEH